MRVAFVMRGALVAVLAVVVSSVGLPGAPAGADPPTPPPLPGVNQPGGPGPCSVTPTSTTPAPNPLAGLARVWVYEPGGSAAPTLTGGTCNDSQRPVLFVTHGFPYDPSIGCLDITPNGFQLVDNMVSNGYIVVFANYACIPAAWWDVDAGFQHGVTMTSREDVDRIGIWGHSWGGVMVSDLAKAAGDRGWGDDAMWLGIFASLDPDNPADLPDHARVLAVVYQGDTIVANADSAVLFNKFTDIPADHKRYVTVRSDCRGANPCPPGQVADHFTPSQPDEWSHLDYYGTFRNVHAFSTCALTNTSCTTANLTTMGTWSDGVAATPALVTSTP